MLIQYGCLFQLFLETRCADPFTAASGNSLTDGVPLSSRPYAYPYPRSYYSNMQNSLTQPGYPYIRGQTPYSMQQMYSPAQMAMPYNYASAQPYYYPNVNYWNPVQPQAHLAPGNAVAPAGYAGIPNPQIPFPWGVAVPTYPPMLTNRNGSMTYAALPNQQIPYSWGAAFPTYPPTLHSRSYLPMLNNSLPVLQPVNGTGNDSSMVQPMQSSFYPTGGLNSLSEGDDQSLTSPVIAANGETGTDINSLPPQVKEFIDMIPDILSMPENSQSGVPAEPSIPGRPRTLPHGLWKHHKPLPSYKKKSYYPQGYYK